MLYFRMYKLCQITYYVGTAVRRPLFKLPNIIISLRKPRAARDDDTLT